MVLELGGNDPIIVMEDADIDEASTLAVQGSYKKQRTALHGDRSGCWYMNCRRRIYRAGGDQDQGVVLRRPGGYKRRHGHRGSTSRRHACLKTVS